MSAAERVREFADSLSKRCEFSSSGVSLSLQKRAMTALDADLHALLARLAVAEEDARRLDWLEHIVRGSAEDGWVEVYLSGLRHGIGSASAFQVETNPNNMGTVSATTLRAAIDAARTAERGVES